MKKCKARNCKKEALVKGYCHKHYKHIVRYGEIRERTCRDKNKIKCIGKYCYMEIYNTNSEVINVVKFNKEHYERVKKYNWFFKKNRVCKTPSLECSIKSFTIFLMKGKEKYKKYFFINGDRNDYTDKNISNFSLKNKNYTYNKKLNLFYCRHFVNGKNKLGKYFKTEEDAKNFVNKYKNKLIKKTKNTFSKV